MRYQSGLGYDGTMDTEAWFAALLRGIDGPLGAVLDVGCAEGVMCVLAKQAGAESVLGIGLHDDRMTEALRVTADHPKIIIQEAEAHAYEGSHRTVVFSMMAHWLGPDETARYAHMATRNFAVIFRTANDHYTPDNGHWFPTLAEMDEVVGGVRTHEELLLTQDNGKEVWAATYRTDLRISGDTVIKHGQAIPLRSGFDLHGDPPFRPTHGKPVQRLSGQNAEAVRELIRRVLVDWMHTGSYPTDLSPRNVIVNGPDAWLVDDEPRERGFGPLVDPEFLPIWQATLSSIGMDFDGDLRSLL